MRGIAVLSFLLTLLFTPIVIWVLKRLKVNDIPNDRSSHVEVTPRGGGTGVFLGAVTGLLLSGVAGVAATWSLKTLMACVSIFAIVGLIDDIRGLDVKPRLAAQVACATAFVGPWFFNNVPVVDHDALKFALAIGAVIWVIGFLNAFNFMDGINGISCFHTIVAGVTFTYIGHLHHIRVLEVCGITIAAAAAGFLPYNFPRARVFLGDVGSYFIGTWLAITALIALIWATPVEAVLAPFVIYLADTAVTLVDRVRRGEDWRRSHRDHVYQQLVDGGWTHARTALTVTAFSAVSALLGLVSLTTSLGARVLADGAIFAVVVAYLFLPRLLAGAEAPAPALRRETSRVSDKMIKGHPDPKPTN